jgi:hypothetical protein
MSMFDDTFASVFRFRNNEVADSESESWEKLEDDHPFSKLQLVFWGEKIEDDAKQWRGESQSSTGVENDEDDDIGPGCYVLNLDDDLQLKNSKMWVRQDYIRIYDYCMTRYEEGPHTVRETPRSVVITGQPGIGLFFFPQ